MGFSMVMPFMAMYIVGRGGSGAQFGIIYMIAGLAAAASQAVAGELADRKGRRFVMLMALGLRAVNMCAMGAAVLFDASILPLAVLIVMNGILRAQYEPAASAAVTDSVTPERRVAAFGLQRMGLNVGWALGPMIGGTAVAHGGHASGYGALFFVAAAATTITALFVAQVRDVPRTAPREPAGWTLAGLVASLRENRPFFIYLGLVFLGGIVTVQLFSTLSVYSKHELGLSEGRIGQLYAVNGALVILLQVPAVRFIERGGLRRALVFGPILYAAGYVAIGLATSFVTLAGAVALITAGEVVFAPALSDMAAHLGDPKRLGRAFGLFGLMQQLGFSFGPLAGGLSYDYLRHHHLGMWGAIAAGMAAVGCGYIWFARKYRVS
jgi:MFS family permease